MPTETWRITNEFMDRHIDSILTAQPCLTSCEVRDRETGVSEWRFRVETNARKRGSREMLDYAASRSADSAQKMASA